jgi:UDP-glucose 4-epimerase
MTKELIVVTGGAGFIGSHLIERLIVNYKVISIDNYFTGSKENHIDGASMKAKDALGSSSQL